MEGSKTSRRGIKGKKYFLKNRKEGNEERELNWTNCKKKEIMGLQQKTQVHMVQVESEVEDGDNGLPTNKCRPKRRKWKSQARNCEERGGIKYGQMTMKRLASFLIWDNPNSKRIKGASPKETFPSLTSS